ncbi:MAG: type III-A CRISPR-associated RAMP protein Csm3 [Bacillota bacterium]
MKLQGKLFIEGTVKAETGLAIGGSNTDVVIGGIDNSVIKNSKGVPFVPGSSLKGKVRSLLEKKAGKSKVCSCGKCDICAIFGVGAGSKDNEVGSTRLYVRDLKLNQSIREKMEDKEGDFSELELTYTETKTENSINRKTSEASNPRQTERVPAGAKFDLNIVYNIMQDQDVQRFRELMVGLRLLEDDYLGSNGSRGYGRVKFEDFNVKLKTVKDYEGDNKPQTVYEGELADLDFAALRNDLTSRLGAE